MAACWACRPLLRPIPPAQSPTPTEKYVIPAGAASKGSKGHGSFVDVWRRGCFIWEYKRKGTRDT